MLDQMTQEAHRVVILTVITNNVNEFRPLAAERRR